MKKLFGWLLHPLLLGLLGVAALAIVIWWIGPLLAIDRWRPLEPARVRWSLIAAIAALWLGGKLLAALRARLANARLLDRLQQAPAAAPTAPAPGQAEVALLEQRFAEATTLLKKLRLSAAGRRPGLRDLLALSGRQYLYQLPWYLLIGAPGSGKTTALLHSGLRFPLAEQFGTAKIRGVAGTRNCDWWFTDEAVLLDTAGRYTTQESDRDADAGAWQGFLRLLRKARPRQPINGVVLTIGVDDLLQQSPAQRQAQAQALRARLQELHEQLGLRFPIYLLVTKADLLAGFDEFFADLSADERAQVWGASFALPQSARAAQPAPDQSLVASFAAEFDALHERLLQRTPGRMQAERDPARRAAIFAFAQQFASLRQALGETVDAVFAASRFEQAPLLRGVYFASGTQEGSPIDRVVGALARSLGLERRLPPPPRDSARSYFLTQLLREVAFAEQGLAGANLRLERRRSALRWGVCALGALLLVVAAAAWLGSYARNRDYVDAVQARLAPLQAQLDALPPLRGENLEAAPLSLRGHSDAAALLPLLRAVRELAATAAPGDDGRPWSMGLGLHQGDKLGAAADQAWRRLLQDAFWPRVANRVEEQLRGAKGGNPEFAYEALKAYLMLHEPAHFDAEALQAWIGFDWQRSLPSLAAPQRAELEQQLATLFERGAPGGLPPADAHLVGGVRALLARSPFAERVYSRLARQRVGAELPEFTVAAAAGPAAPLVFTRASGQPLTQGVPGLYSFDGYHKHFIAAAAAVTRQLADEQGWVLGIAAPADATTPTSAVARLAGRAPGAGERLADDVRRLYLNDYARRWEEFLADIKLLRPASLTQSLQMARLLSAPDNPLVPLLRKASHETTLTRAEADKSLVDKAAGRLQGTRAEIDKLFGADAAPAPSATKAPQLEQIVDDRFAALRRLVSAPAAGQPAPVDASIALLGEVYTMLSAVETALKGNVTPPPSEVPAKVKAESARLPEPLRGVLQTLAGASAQQVAGASRDSLSAALGSGIGEFCRQAISGRYPFVRGSSRDVLPDDFARVFAPGGLIDGFFQKNLAERVDTATRPWSFKRLGEVSFGDPGALLQFQRAQAIREVFFRGGGNAAALRLEFKPVEMDAAVTQFILDVDGQLVRYSHGPQVPQTVQWPGPRGSTQVRLQMQPAGPGGVSGLTTEGPWALFRLFDKVQLEATDDAARFKAVFEVDGRKAAFEIVASSVRNPFRLRELEQFQCPAGL